MSGAFHHVRRVEFADTDMAGIAHFSAFFRYMEETEHAFLRSLGLSVVMHDQDGPFGWPRVSARCDYVGPIRFEDLLDIGLHVRRKGRSSITYAFSMSHAGRPVAHGELTVVCCRLSPGQPPASIPLPDWISQKILVTEGLPA